MPKMSPGETRLTLKEMADKWKELDEAKREDYEQRSAKSRATYMADVSKWKANITGTEEAKALEKVEVRLGKLRLRKRQLKQTTMKEDSAS